MKNYSSLGLPVLQVNSKYPIRILIILMALLTLGCMSEKKPKEIHIVEVGLKDGLLYEKNAKKPFTGLLVDYDDDVLIESHSIKNGVEDGPSRKYHENGVHKSDVMMKQGQPDGILRTWFISGKPATEITFIEGKAEGLSKKWYSNGQIAEETPLVNGRTEGLECLWYENGQKFGENEHKNGRLNGNSKTWREDGTIESEGSYSQSKKDGTWKSWDEHGIIIIERDFDNGELIDKNLLLSNEVLDVDGNVYKTKKIGNQVWMIENLRATHYQDGTPIISLKSDRSWVNAPRGGYSYYNSDENKAVVYGALYNWFAVNDERNIAPRGWHIPSIGEWEQMISFLKESRTNFDNSEDLNSDIGSELAGRKELWKDGSLKNNDHFGMSGINILPGGWRQGFSGSYVSINELAQFWSSTQHSDRLEWAFKYRVNYYGGSSSGPYEKNDGASVRCIKN